MGIVWEPYKVDVPPGSNGCMEKLLEGLAEGGEQSMVALVDGRFFGLNTYLSHKYHVHDQNNNYLGFDDCVLDGSSRRRENGNERESHVQIDHAHCNSGDG